MFDQARLSLTVAGRLAHAGPRDQTCELLAELAELMDAVGNTEDSQGLLLEAGQVAAQTTDTAMRAELLAQTATALYRLNHPEAALKVVTENNLVGASSSLLNGLAVEAAMAGHRRPARTLLAATLDDTRQRPWLRHRAAMGPGYSTAIATARAGEWELADRVSRIAHLEASRESSQHGQRL